MRVKNFLAIATLISLACTACTSDVYLGNPEDISQEVAISFDGGTGKSTRAMQGGQAAATALGSNFVVYGWKTMPPAPGTQQTVFDHYNVNYTDGSAHSTLSNSAGWEYAGQAGNVLNGNLGTTGTQDIKYWDFSAKRYDFVAFSAGAATQVASNPGDDQVAFSPIGPISPMSPIGYSITGTPADLTKVYIADRVTAQQTPVTTIPNRLVTYRDAVQFAFRPLAAKVRIGFYETIPGYSVKDVKFYLADGASTTTPTIFAGSATMPSGIGTVTLKFNSTDDTSNKDYNRVEVASYADGLGKDVALQAITSGTYVTKENLEGGRDNLGNPVNPGQVFLARSSNEATTSGYQLVVPTGKANTLTLKMDYTLISTDISQEEIKVHGATAIIPSEFCNWQPNHAYTYLFKISDHTSGWTNPTDADHVGLYPVTFDAMVAATEEGMQQSITLIAAPSITTYAKGERIHEDTQKLNYYEVGNYNLYICLQPSTHSMTDTNVKLYKATASTAITEAVVADVIKAGTENPAGTFVKDGVTVTTTDASTLTVTNDGIPADDAPYGTAIPGNFAVFQPTTADTYVFEYTSPEEHYSYDEFIALPGNDEVTPQQFAALSPDKTLKPNKHYKVIIVK